MPSTASKALTCQVVEDEAALFFLAVLTLPLPAGPMTSWA